MSRTHAPHALAVALALGPAGCADVDGRGLRPTSDGDAASASTPDARESGAGLTAWLILFDPGVDLRACGDPSRGLRVATAFSDDQGRLAAGWPGGDVFLASGTGMVTAGSFELAFGCAPAGSPAGAVSATRVELHYEGTWSFDGRSGIAMIAPAQHEMILLEGHVRAADDGAVLVGAEVGTSLDAATVTTDARGHFFLETRTALARGASVYRVRVRRAGYEPLDAEVTGERALGLDLRLVAAP